MGCAEAAVENGRHSNTVYEVNLWLWQFGCGLGGLTIKETFDRKETTHKASDKCGKETSEHSKGNSA